MPKYLKIIEREHFRQGTLNLWWQFLTERQNVWVRRAVLGLPSPWTLDPILEREFFTNVYRELDPGTEYVMSDILVGDEDPRDVLFNVMMFRLMGSQIETHRTLGFQHVDTYDAARVKKKLRKIPLEDTKFFGDAYRVASYQNIGEGPKGEVISKLLGQIAVSTRKIHKNCKNPVL